MVNLERRVASLIEASRTLQLGGFSPSHRLTQTIFLSTPYSRAPSDVVETDQVTLEEETKLSLNISPSSHASGTWSGSGSLSRDAPNSHAHASFFSPGSRQQHALVHANQSPGIGTSSRWLLNVSHDSEKVGTVSQFGKRPYSCMNHPLQEEMEDCSTSTKGDKKMTASNERRNDRMTSPSQENTLDEASVSPIHLCRDDQAIGDRVDDDRLQHKPQGTTDSCHGFEAEDQVDETSPYGPAEMPKSTILHGQFLGSLGGMVELDDTHQKEFTEEAIHSGTPHVVRAVLKALREPRAFGKLTDAAFIAAAARDGGGELFETLLDAIQDKISIREVCTVLSSALHVAAADASRDLRALSAISILVQHGAKPSNEDLILLAHVVDVDKLDDCFFRAIESARNSFIPGLNISVSIENALEDAKPLERNKLRYLKNEVDKLLVEVLRWLPEKVQDIPGGMSSCAALLEPEVTNTHSPTESGPLFMMLHCQRRIETLATSPLGMDFMSMKFTRGLPGLTNAMHTRMVESPHLDPRDEAKCHECLTALCEGYWVGRILKGVGMYIYGDPVLSCSTSVLPGGHFITTGIIALPNAYYNVPAVRMTFDLIVFIGLLTLFMKEVLLTEDGPIRKGEIAFAVCTSAALLNEIMELGRNVERYMINCWHKLDLFALQMCLVAFVIRVIDGDSSWGKGLYAICTPLLFWRFLYFAQVFRFQGALIQVIYAMTEELMQFGIVMGAVMLGFAMAFFALFRELEGMTLTSALLKVFKAMLGEVGFFDDFTGTRFDAVATLLLVFYLIIMAIMLLNLLIAVLSTAHSKVEHSVLIRVATARLFMFYRRVTVTDILPAPFNLVQMVIVFPCVVVDFVLRTKTRLAAKQLVGRVVFWLIMGPMAIIGGSILWLVSMPKAMLAVWGSQISHNNSLVSKLKRTVLCVVWSIFGVPIFLVTSWLAQAPMVFTGQTFSLEAPRPMPTFSNSLDGILKEATGGKGMSYLRAHMRDPMNDAIVCQSKLGWQDQASTLGHVKTLGKWLEASAQERIENMKRGLEEKISSTMEKVERLDAKLDRLHTMLSSWQKGV